MLSLSGPDDIKNSPYLEGVCVLFICAVVYRFLFSHAFMLIELSWDSQLKCQIFLVSEGLETPRGR